MERGNNMAKMNENIKLGKKGVNFVTTIVDESMCSFHQISQENDVGIDGQIELFNESKFPIGKLISVQIKTGKTYYDLNHLECTIPIESHKDYWLNIEIPIVGIVCIMDKAYESVCSAFWVNIKEFLLENPTATDIKFKICQHNEFSKENFRKYFYPLMNKSLLQINIDETLRLLGGNILDKLLAIDMLQVKFSHDVKAWESLFSIYERKDLDIDYSSFFDSISYVCHHPDHWGLKGIHEFSVESAKFVEEKIKSFTKEDIINILRTIENHFFDRGTRGQTADIIISNIMGFEQKLLDIILDSKVSNDIKYDAEVILAHQNKEYYLENIKQIKKMNIESTDLLLKYIKKYGEYAFY